jgi:hypothetical protein
MWHKEREGEEGEDRNMCVRVWERERERERERKREREREKEREREREGGGEIKRESYWCFLMNKATIIMHLAMDQPCAHVEDESIARFLLVSNTITPPIPFK